MEKYHVPDSSKSREGLHLRVVMWFAGQPRFVGLTAWGLEERGFMMSAEPSPTSIRRPQCWCSPLPGTSDITLSFMSMVAKLNSPKILYSGLHDICGKDYAAIFYGNGVISILPLQPNRFLLKSYPFQWFSCFSRSFSLSCVGRRTIDLPWRHSKESIVDLEWEAWVHRFVSMS